MSALSDKIIDENVKFAFEELERQIEEIKSTSNNRIEKIEKKVEKPSLSRY